MKGGFFSKLALNNIKKNYRFFIPGILAEAGLLACFYIAFTLAADDRLAHIKGGNTIPTLMMIGTLVLALLSAVLMFYINSFLMKQRTREFGIYNVLGMEKRHIARVLFRETFISSFISILLGLITGILFYKLCSLGICRLLQTDIVIGFYYISYKTVLPSALFFIVLDLLTYLFSRIRIARMKPVELLRSLSAGEKEPKVKWIMLVIGLLALGGGYYISLTMVNPVQAMTMFFVAVLLVIIGTYFLFVSGSIFVLKLLKSNKKFYYHKNRMPAISGLLYRMKQNAVGLGSIAILATGVLVMVSTTVSLYAGYDATLNKNYPQDLYLSAQVRKGNEEFTLSSEKLEKIVRTAANKAGVGIKKVEHGRFLSVVYYTKDNNLTSSKKAEDATVSELKYLSQVTIITASQYNELTQNHIKLESHEIMMTQISQGSEKTLELNKAVGIEGKSYKVKKLLYQFPIANNNVSEIVSTYGIVVKDDEEFNRICNIQKKNYGGSASEFDTRISVDFENRDEAVKKGEQIDQYITDEIRKESTEGFTCDIDSYWKAKEALLGMYGTLLFLGILLGLVCLFATTLIIYYKQISEGYEDRQRFQIMEKIGMSHKEVKKTINSQVLLVFLLPLFVAGIHLCFAFPMLHKMMKIMALYSFGLFVKCSIATFIIFAIVYIMIYKVTSKIYYRIIH